MNSSEIASLARAAGFPESSIPIAVAVALAESSGNPRAFNGRGNDESYGLWQINMKGALGPARRAQFGLSSNDQLYDPQTNARAALAISGGGSSWRPWGAYTNGSYRKYLSSAGNGTSGDVPSPPGLPDLGTINTPFGEVKTIYLLAGVALYLLLK